MGSDKLLCSLLHRLPRSKTWLEFRWNPAPFISTWFHGWRTRPSTDWSRVTLCANPINDSSYYFLSSRGIWKRRLLFSFQAVIPSTITWVLHSMIYLFHDRILTKMIVRVTELHRSSGNYTLELLQRPILTMCRSFLSTANRSSKSALPHFSNLSTANEVFSSVPMLPLVVSIFPKLITLSNTILLM